MAQITNLILFFSKFSNHCKPCLEFIIRNKLPVEFIELDSEESRNFATKCSVQIVNVPSLVLILSNGETSLYVGSPKIISWLTILIKQNTQQPIPSNIPSFQSTQIDQPTQINKSVARMLSGQSGRIQIQEESEESEEYQETQINLSDDEQSPIPISSGTAIGLSTTNVNKPSNTDIMNRAKQMMKEREDTLGVKSDGS